MTSSASTFTYWSLLGIAPGSNSIELKQAFKREAMRWHPDLNKNDRNAEERFKFINEAYKVLSDPQRRLEWEVSGKPSIKLEEFPQPSPKISSFTKSKEPLKIVSGFNSAEKLLILLISGFVLIVLNTLLI